MKNITKFVTLTSVMALTSLAPISVFADDVTPTEPTSGVVTPGETAPTTDPTIPTTPGETAPTTDPTTPTTPGETAPTTDPTIPTTPGETAPTTDPTKPTTGDNTTPTTDPTKPTTGDNTTPKTDPTKPATGDNTTPTTPGNTTPVTPGVIDNVDSQTGKITINPVQVNPGKTVVGTQDGNLIVRDDSGNQSVVTATSLGGHINDNGTVTIKDSEGKEKTLPHTGETATTFLKILGFLMVIAGAVIAFKQKKIIKK